MDLRPRRPHGTDKGNIYIMALRLNARSRVEFLQVVFTKGVDHEHGENRQQAGR